MVLNILKMYLVLFLIQSLLQAIQDLSNVKRIEDDKWKVVDIFLDEVAFVVADLHDC